MSNDEWPQGAKVVKGIRLGDCHHKLSELLDGGWTERNIRDAIKERDYEALRNMKVVMSGPMKIVGLEPSEMLVEENQRLREEVAELRARLEAKE